MDDKTRCPCTRAEWGFTLIELVVAILIFALGIMGIMKMHQASVQANNFSMQLTQAVNYADDRVEFLRGLDFTHNSMSVGAHNTSIINAPRGIPYSVSYRVETTPQSNNLARSVTVSVTWQEKAINHRLDIPVIFDEMSPLP